MPLFPKGSQLFISANDSNVCLKAIVWIGVGELLCDSRPLTVTPERA